MNFKTTIILLVLLIVVGSVALFVTRNPSDTGPAKTDISGRKLFDLKSDHVNRVSITDKDGKHTTLVKENDKWKLTEPIKSLANESSVSNLIDTLVDLHSSGRLEKDPGSASGLESPSYQVELGTDDGKTAKFKLGAPMGPDTLYAQVDGSSDIDLVSASLAGSLKTAATDLRDKHLVDAKDSAIKQVRITSGTETIELSKPAGKWVMTSPERSLADEPTISSLLFAITGLEASEYVKSGSPELTINPFARPRLTVWFSTAEPSTQPSTATAQPAGTTITFGMPDNLGDNPHYFVKTSDGTIAKVDKTALDELKKSPLDFRDRTVATIAPDTVTRIAITKETFPPPPPAATQPATQASTAPSPSVAPAAPLSHKTIVLVKRHTAVLGPPAPATNPSASQPSTKPEEAQSVWQLEGDDKAQIDDAKVADLLSKYNPLTATKFVDLIKAAPVEKFTLDITATAPGSGAVPYHFEIINPPGTQTPMATNNGLAFEIPREALNVVDVDFVRK